MLEGSNTKEGWLYHNLPGLDVPSHRQGTEYRADFILSKLGDVKGKLILDLGCAAGGISYLFGKAGAYVEGVDYDENALSIGRSFIEGKKGLGSVVLKQREINFTYIKNLPHYDIILWLSQWQWLVKQSNLHTGLEALFEISKKCDTLVFESSASDGRAGIKGTTQDTICEWVVKNTAFSEVERYKADSKGWHDRDLFVCSKPIFEWRRHRDVVIRRINRQFVEKTSESLGVSPIMFRSISFFDELDDTSIVPKVVNIKPKKYIMTYEGIPITRLTDNDIELILTCFKKHGITHRDLIPSNLLWNGKNVVVIDFAWAIHDGEKVKAPKNLGEKYKSPNGFNDEYSLRLIQKELEAKL